MALGAGEPAKVDPSESQIRSAKINRTIGGTVFAALLLLDLWLNTAFEYALIVGPLWLVQYYLRYAVGEQPVSKPKDAVLVLAVLFGFFAISQFYGHHKDHQFEADLMKLCSGRNYDQHQNICNDVFSAVDAWHAPIFHDDRD